MAARLLRRRELLIELGGTRALHAALHEGRWLRLLQGVYGAEVDPRNLELRARAAQLVLPAHAVVSGHSVLWLCGVDVLPAGATPLEVTVPREAVVPRRHGVAARQALLAPRDLGRIRHVRALRPPRATLDLVRQLPLPDAVAVADAVQHAGLCSRRELEEELLHHRGLRGVRNAGRAIELSAPEAESPPESRLRVLLALAGLQPVPQYEIHDPVGRFVARVDLAFPAQRLALEYDGRDVHQRDDVFTHDRRRQNALVALGWTVLRFTAADLRGRSPGVVAQVAGALALTRAS